MLVLSRKRGEKIEIGDGIVVKVIRIGKSVVKIGIEAPDDVRVMRAELCEAPTAVVPAKKETNYATSNVTPAVSDQFPHAV